MSEKKKAVLYLRYSSASQTEQSIEGQRTVCKKFADLEGYEVIQEYVDRATSASHDTRKRLSFLQMIDDAASKDFEAVIVYKLDRFARNRYDSAIYKNKLKQYGIRVVSATEPLSGRPEDILMESVLEGMAEYYSVELAEKVKRGIRESVEKRQWLGGQTPFGFKVENKHLVPDPAKKPAVKQAFQMVLDGKSFEEITSYLNSLGFRNARGCPLTTRTVFDLLHSKRVIGFYVYDGVEVEGAIEPLITKELFYAVQNRLASVRRKRHNMTTYLLSNRLFCGHCGLHMIGAKGRSKNGEYYYYYVCRGQKKRFGCHKRSIRKEEIEDLVIKETLKLLTDETIDQIVNLIMGFYKEKELETQDPIRELEKQVKLIEAQIENGLNAVLSGFASKPLTDKLEKLNLQKRQLEEQIDELKNDQVPLDPEMIRFYLTAFREKSLRDKNWQHKLVNTFIKKVTLWDEAGKRNKKLEIVYNLSDSNGELKQFDLDDSQATICNIDEHPVIINFTYMVLIVKYIL